MLSIDQHLTSQKSPIRLAILKISNISWDLASSDIIDLLKEHTVQPEHVHIPIDRDTGKTRNDMFVEFIDLASMTLAIQVHNKVIIKSRSLLFSASTFQELHDAHFPLPPEEVRLIINICRYYKCAERPFEHIISILRLIPWWTITDEMSLELFELAKNGIESLMMHMDKPNPQINPSLLPRLVRGSVFFPTFTERQKDMLLNSSKLAPEYICPAGAVDSSSIGGEKVSKRHLRRSSIERILKQLGGKEESSVESSNAVESSTLKDFNFMRQAFDAIMLGPN